ncbi:MAG: AMP-binding protein, partial [Bacillota bacterium]|nr:AMP-binding protein [Bacillota bacterium]
MSLGIKISEWQKAEYRQKGLWGDATLEDYWDMSVKSSPENTAVVDLQGTTYTYTELDAAAGKVAVFLRDAGVEPGDFVSMQLPGWAEFTVIYIACLKVGAVVNPILPNLRKKELLYILNKCESKVLFIPSRFK